MLKAVWTGARAAGGRDDYLNARFPVSKLFEVALWERPGLWCDDDALASIVEDLRTVARAGQGGKDVPYYGALLGEREDLSTRVIAIAYTREGGVPVGFNALSYFDIAMGGRIESVLHLGLTFVDPEYQRKRLPSLLYGLTAFLLLFKRGLRSFWISNVTQVPAVVGMVSRNYGDVYPHYAGVTRQTFSHLLLARSIMQDHRAAFGVGDDADFDEAQQIIKNAYTGGSDELKKTFEEAPKHREAAVNEFCALKLDYERGDDFLQLGKCSLRSTLKFLGEKLPQGSMVQLSFRAAVLLFFATFVPVVRWLTAASEPLALEEATHERD